MAVVRRSSLAYRMARGKNPKYLFLSRKLASILTGQKYGEDYEDGYGTGDYYDENHCMLDIYIASRDMGDSFNIIGDMEDYKNAVTEYWLLTESNSPVEEKYDKSSSVGSNITSIFSKRHGGI